MESSLTFQEMTSISLSLLLILTINSSPNFLLQMRTSSLSFRQMLFSMRFLSLQIFIKAFTSKFWILLLWFDILIFYSLPLLSLDDCLIWDVSNYLRRGMSCKRASVLSLLLLVVILANTQLYASFGYFVSFARLLCYPQACLASFPDRPPTFPRRSTYRGAGRNLAISSPLQYASPPIHRCRAQGSREFCNP